MSTSAGRLRSPASKEDLPRHSIIDHHAPGFTCPSEVHAMCFILSFIHNTPPNVYRKLTWCRGEIKQLTSTFPKSSERAQHRHLQSHGLLFPFLQIHKENS